MIFYNLNVKVVRICWNHSMFEAYLHFYTDILMDFQSPFDELVQALINKLAIDPNIYLSNRSL